MTTPTPTVLLVDEYPHLGGRVLDVLQLHCNVVRCRIDEAHALSPEADVAVLVMDEAELADVAALAHHRPETAILVLASEPSRDLEIRAILCGAQEVLTFDQITPLNIRTKVALARARGHERAGVLANANAARTIAVGLVADAVRSSLEPAVSTLAAAFTDPQGQQMQGQAAIESLQDIIEDLAAVEP